MLGGTSNTTDRWGWLGFLFHIENFLPCCLCCLTRLLNNEDTSTDHRDASNQCCGNWTMEGLTYPPLKDYSLVILLPSQPPSWPFRNNNHEAIVAACNFTSTKTPTASGKNEVAASHSSTSVVTTYDVVTFI